MILSLSSIHFLFRFCLALIPTILSLVLYLAPKKGSKLESEKYRNFVLQKLFNNSLFLTVGGWATFLSDNYIWIIIALSIGGLSFIRDLNVYIFKIKKVIDDNARVEELILTNYDYIYKVFKKSGSLIEFSQNIGDKFKLSNEVMFNLYNNFRSYEEKRYEESDTYSAGNNSELSEAYSILGISKDDSIDDIRKAFREKAKLMHPDFTKRQDDSGFKKLNAAYQLVLENKGYK